MRDHGLLMGVLADVASGRLSPAEAASSLTRAAGAADACIDFDRETRCGFPEVVLASGKTPEQAAAIARAIHADAGHVLVTRASPEHARVILEVIPEARFDERSRLVTASATPRARTGLVALVAAGTADLPVAEEAAGTAEAMGAHVERFYDVGVAGLHRLLGVIDRIREANVIVVVAGMEGALPSVVAGLVAKPVIGVPTSVGYGASFSGLAALLAMLNSCAANVTIVNIDNGFGAGYSAALVNRNARAAGRE